MHVPGFNVHRSGLRWLRGDGYVCRAGEVLAYCNVRLSPAASGTAARPFAEERRDFQVAFAPRVGGRLHRDSSPSHGGFLDQHPYYEFWTPDLVFGHVQRRPGEPAPDCDAGGETTQLLMVAGRRATELAEDRSGLLTGWHDRSRAWWGEGKGRRGTLLGLGICELLGVMRGERRAFVEWFEAVDGPAHVVHVPDDVLAPCAAVVLEQHARTPAQSDAIAADFARTLAAGSIAPTPHDWIFAGALMSALRRTPLDDRCDLLTRGGLQQAGPPDAVVLSLNAEPASLLRHRRLGYALHCHDFRIAEAGPAIRAWLQTDFEPVRRTLDDSRRDCRALVDLLRERGARCLMLNAMSTFGHEGVNDYAAFDAPLGDTLGSVRNKDRNLMLHDLARECGIDIVDVDALAAELGASRHLPDGMHPSGTMEAAVRAEILRILRDRGVPGFQARGAT